MATWWNPKYGFRRNLTITPSTGLPIRAGYPLFVKFNYITLSSLNKIRPDLSDIEILYLQPDEVTWTVLDSYAQFLGNDVVVYFDAVTDILSTNNRYWVYMSNPSLSNVPSTNSYVPNLYSIDTSQTGGMGLSFTRPTEDWLDNTSAVPNARATFSFFGINARVTVEKGPDKGILEIKVDENPPVLLDCFAATTSQQVIYTTSDLTLGQHYLRMRVTGEKNAASSGRDVKLIKVQYSQYTQAAVKAEEVNTANAPFRITVGP